MVMSLTNDIKSQHGCPKALSLTLYFSNFSINDLFFFTDTTSLWNYLYDCTMYSADKNPNIVTLIFLNSRF